MTSHQPLPVQIFARPSSHSHRTNSAATSLARSRLLRGVVLAVGLIAWTHSAGTVRAQEGQQAENSGEAQYLSHVRQVTSGYIKAGEGYFSPDGETIVYQAVPEGYSFYQIYLQPLTGGEVARLSTGRGRTTCSYFSPDGERVIFASSHFDPNLAETEQAALRQQREDEASGRQRRYSWEFDPHMDIVETDRQGNLLRRLTNEPGYDAECAFSPDGENIVFCSDRDGDPDIYVMDSDGSNIRQITDAPGYDGGPFFSPDGKWIIFRSDRKREGYLQIYAIGADGENEIALTDNEGVNWAPYWHPTEPYIIWAGADHSDPTARPNYDLWLMRYEVADGKLSGGPITRITDHAAADVLPVFSPDGQRLMWTSTRTEDGASQLWIADFKLPDMSPSEASSQ
ncbi:MAG: biopolymer transporter Tol [Pirellulales bacterium]